VVEAKEGIRVSCNSVQLTTCASGRDVSGPEVYGKCDFATIQVKSLPINEPPRGRKQFSCAESAGS
jgi:hypothetical protein